MFSIGFFVMIAAFHYTTGELVCVHIYIYLLESGQMIYGAANCNCAGADGSANPEA